TPLVRSIPAVSIPTSPPAPRYHCPRKRQRPTTSLRRAAPGARVPRTRNPRKNSLCREPTRGHLAPRSSRNLPHLVGGTTRWTGRSPTDTTTNFRRVQDLIREPGTTSGV